MNKALLSLAAAVLLTTNIYAGEIFDKIDSAHQSMERIKAIDKILEHLDHDAKLLWFGCSYFYVDPDDTSAIKSSVQTGFYLPNLDDDDPYKIYKLFLSRIARADTVNIINILRGYR